MGGAQDLAWIFNENFFCVYSCPNCTVVVMRGREEEDEKKKKEEEKIEMEN